MHLGAGKSSLVAALLRMTPLSAGVIKIDGRDIASVPLRQLRSAVGVVSQQPFLFEGKSTTTDEPIQRLWVRSRAACNHVLRCALGFHEAGIYMKQVFAKDHDSTGRPETHGSVVRSQMHMVARLAQAQ